MEPDQPGTERADGLGTSVEPPANPPAPGKTLPQMMGEVVENRPWWQLLIVLAFGLLLAAAPFIYMREGNPYAQAVATYDQMCRARAAGDFQAIRKMLSARTLVISNPDLERHVALWKCPDRAQADLTWEALPHDPAAPGERHHLVITDRADQTVSDTLRFVRESDGMRWDPM